MFGNNGLKAIIAAVVACSAIANPALAKDKQQLSGLALQQVQARDIEAPKSITFPAAMSVLQDAGYRIGDADIVTGIITAQASTKTKMTWLPFVGFGTKKKTPVISVFVEDMTPTLSRVRLNFVMAKIKNGILADEDPIYDAAWYQDAFEKINQAVFIRLAMASKAPAPASTVPAAVEAATQPK